MKAILWTIGALVRTFIVLLVVALGIVQVRACSPATSEEARLAEVRAQLAFLRRSLREDDAAPRMQRTFPEGACFLATLYALTWANLARSSPDDATRDAAADEVEYALGVIDSPTATRPFRDTQVPRGVFWSGQRNLVLAELLDLQTPAGRRPERVAEFHEASRAIAEAFVASATHHLDTFPDACWPADQMAALASLPVHDRLYGTDHARAGRAWAAWTRTHLDPATGLPPGEIDPKTGATLQPARGCGMSWMLALLPRVDPEHARQTYARTVEKLGVTRLGLRAFAEWPEGAEGAADVDSGPVVWRVGTAATGIGLAAARAGGDAVRAADIRGLAQGFGFPWTSDDPAEKRCLLGELPIADAFLAFGLSTPPPSGTVEDVRDRGALLAERWKFHALVTALQLALAAIVVRGVRRGRRARNRPGAERTPRPATSPP